VFVQQTAHSQGSAFLRGLTGQQTLLLFDGIRLNNSTYRQGPNQYFFTLDTHSLEAIDVMRGGASTRHGSDALGGALLALPRTPRADRFRPRLLLRGTTADDERGGRLEAEGKAGPAVRVLAGAGARRVGLLRSGGPVRNPANGELPAVPRFASDGRTQLGTGFRELTADARLQLAPPATGHELVLASYLYRQFDAPRTDQCPAPGAPFDECLRYDEQFRTLVYASWQAEVGQTALSGLRATLSWQQQRERRTLDRPGAAARNLGRDVVDTWGFTFAAHSRALRPTQALRLRSSWGADGYLDQVDSAAWIQFSDIGVTQQRSRGQYLDGSRYFQGGLFAELEARLRRHWIARSGARLSWIAARAPADPDSGSAPVQRTWVPLVGHAALEWQTRPWLSLHLGADRSFRAPNLDDLTSRQQTGPGFQFENPALGPELATSIELGGRTHGPLRAELWSFATRLDDAVVKRPREASDCPADTPACGASWTRLQLVNAPGRSLVWGAEATLAASLPAALEGRATLSWARGSAPNVADPPGDPTLPYEQRVPLSRIPPLNGSAELIWRHRGWLVAGALRWAGAQTRLALADRSDGRIPLGGTPGFAVCDVRAAYRHGDKLVLAVALENLFDAAYRYHGSSVNGPGRGLVLVLQVSP
jgi:iron complex outermembrane receptor protein/hemoglobin/transferrin/lactoferrin receptor protein